MSKENIVRFLEAADSNPDLQAKLSEIRHKTTRKVAGEIASLSAEHGIPFSVEEFLESQNESAGELSEKELGTISGGDLGYGGHLIRNWS